jgi:hypothetical protein
MPLVAALNRDFSVLRLSLSGGPGGPPANVEKCISSVYFDRMTRALRTINLAPPYHEVLLWVHLDHDENWRFQSWDVPPGINIPATPPATTLSMSFRTSSHAARFFTRKPAVHSQQCGTPDACWTLLFPWQLRALAYAEYERGRDAGTAWRS